MPEPLFLLTKHFRFSASHESGTKVFGHNYVLSVTVNSLSRENELRLCTAVDKKLISKIHSRDLSLHVDFLKGLEIGDQSLLEAFYRQLLPDLGFCRVLEMSLQRDDDTQTRVIFNS